MDTREAMQGKRGLIYQMINRMIRNQEQKLIRMATIKESVDIDWQGSMSTLIVVNGKRFLFRNGVLFTKRNYTPVDTYLMNLHSYLNAFRRD
jgi:hypothetical protein